MKEYRIVKQIGEAKPYSICTFNSFEACYIELLRLIKIQEENVKKEYYVVNNFYKNKYPPFLKNIVVFTIQVREVDTWQIYEDKKENKKKINNKIISLRLE